MYWYLRLLLNNKCLLSRAVVAVRVLPKKPLELDLFYPINFCFCISIVKSEFYKLTIHNLCGTLRHTVVKHTH